jgi:hypothetical protein
MKYLLIILLLSACGGFPVQVVQTTSPNGTPVIEHIDDHALPTICGDHMSAAGCWTVDAEGKHHIWRFSMSGTPATRDHELAHVDYGYWHGPWEIDATRTRRCAPVIANTDRYVIGQTVCVDQRGETVF